MYIFNASALPFTLSGFSDFNIYLQFRADSCPIKVPTPASLVPDSKRAATLHGSPISENANLSVAPKFPAIHTPLFTPMPMAIYGMPSSTKRKLRSIMFFSICLAASQARL